VVNRQQQQQRLAPPTHGGEAAADEVAAALGHSCLQEGSVALNVRPQVVRADGARDAPRDGAHNPAASRGGGLVRMARASHPPTPRTTVCPSRFCP